MPQELIKVGACSKHFETIPVVVALDEIIQSSKKSENLGMDRYQLLDIDGYWLVIHQWANDKRAHEKYVCFTTEKDAMDYLDMCGIKKQEC